MVNLEVPTLFLLFKSCVSTYYTNILYYVYVYYTLLKISGTLEKGATDFLFDGKVTKTEILV